MIDVIYEMETQDPDDLFALALLCHHPEVNLRGVVITPGSKHQAAIIKTALKQLDRGDVLVGSFNIDHPKSCVSPWWISFLGNAFGGGVDRGWEIINELLHDYPDLTYISGSPIKNLGEYMKKHDTFNIKRWVAQGGFAGDNIVPDKYRLPKFAGKITCPTFNFNGDPKSAKAALASPCIDERVLVSKNVCHGFLYDQDMHDKFSLFKDENIGLNMIYRGMKRYLSKTNKDGKLFHDPLAICVAIDPTIAELAQVEIYREKGEWGSNPSSCSNTWITINVDKDKAFDIMVDNSKI